MAYELWSQDIFSRGELSPFMYARATVNEYGNGLKTAQNVITYPTGAAGKRFGTLFQTDIEGISSYNELYFKTFQYGNECVYQLVITPFNITIYLEGIQVANLSTPLSAYQVYNLSTTVLSYAFRLSGIGFKPYDLTRAPNVSSDLIDGFTSTSLSASGAAFTPNIVYPIVFSTLGSMPTSFPQLIVGVTYFMNALTATSFEVYSNSLDAKFRNPVNRVTFSDAGVNTSVTIQNTWSLDHVFFKNLPIYDFNGNVTSYDSLTFTPSAVSGDAVTITVSGAGYPFLDTSYVGGAFIGGGGTSRITAVASNTSFTVAVQNPFDSTNAIPGFFVLLAEPAWSDKRGWPQLCSSYQNRSLFANTVSLPNGFYASVINDYADFGDLTNDDDDAISWYPSSDNTNYIRFIVPYRSITVHTNTGIYSSPLSDVAAITPTNFTLQLQDSTPADVLLPQAIDNQVLVLSGNDAHQMLWDGINNAYTSDIVSVINEQTIRTPRDEVTFADLHHAGSRYVFIVNANGSMAMFQTLLAQNVSGFTPAITEQSYGNSSYIQASSSSDGRVWFIVQRQIAVNGGTTAITGFTPLVVGPPAVPSTLHAVGTNISTTVPLAITFTTTGSLPTSVPPIQTNTYYWAIGIDADNFKVYVDQIDALNGVDEFEFSNAGTNSNVVLWPLQDLFTMEELTQDVYLDCAVQYNGAPTSTVFTSGLFNAMEVKMVGDGYGFDAIGINDQVTFEAHGVVTDVSEAFIGFPINTIMEPMPLSIANGSSVKNTTLTKPKHIRTIRFMFNDTIGGTVNGVPIVVEPFSQVNIGEPPFPTRGIFELGVMKGWDDFNNPTYTIEHNEPFNIILLGVFYSVEL